MELCLALRTPSSFTNLPTHVDDQVKSLNKMLASVHAYLVKKPGVWRIIVFGSYMTQPSTTRDVDVACELRVDQGPSIVVAWAKDLGALVKKKIDLIDLLSSFQDHMF